MTEPVTISSRKGFLLSRHWRDSDDGILLQLWFSTPDGAARVDIPGQRAVCFVPHDQPFDSPLIAERRAIDLRSPGGEPVDALYFQRQQQLQHWLQQSARHRQLALEADIKPTERFLMERFIQSAATISGEWHWLGDHWQVQHAQLTATDYEPQLTLASIDIETGMGRDAPLYSIAVECRQHTTVFLLNNQLEPHPLNNCQLQPCADEAGLLEQFFTHLETLDPDILIGWNVVDFDLDFLAHRCKRLRIPFRLGRHRDNAVVLQPQGAGQLRIARIPGRAVLDGIDLLRAGFWHFESYALENVAQQLLGEGKLVSQHGDDKVAEIRRLYEHDPETLAQYNALDTQLVSRIFRHAGLLEFACARARMTGLPIDKLGGSVAAFDHLYLPRLHRRGRVALSLEQVADGVNSPGGYVLNSQPGLYKNVLVLDFKSLYPSIIRSFLIDPWGLMEPGDNPVPGFRDGWFNRHDPILPALITELWQARDAAKRNQDTALSQAVKIIMNSFYGVLGSRGCRFFDPRLASSITMRGHEIITRSRDWIESRGYRVIYGDTDSLFVLCGSHYSQQQARDIGNNLARDINQWWAEQLQQQWQLTSCLEIEFETLYTDFFMPTIRGSDCGSKKRYAGTIRSASECRIVFKGLEAVRTDWTPLARQFQQSLYQKIFDQQPFEQYCRKIVSDLYRGKLDPLLTYRKRIRRPLDSYQKNVPPHIQAARKLPKPDRWIEYAITLAGPEPIQTRMHDFDYEHYRQRQLAPVADAILQFFNTDLASICDDQLTLF